MAQILIFVEQSENRRLLVEYLKQYYQVIVGKSTASAQPNCFPDEQFDLCILDGRALAYLWESIQARKQHEQPVFLPVLLISSRPDVKLMTRNLWESVDELIARPIEKAELRVRVEMLLRSRRFSLQLSESLAREREQNALKSRFISIASHEFRSPLNMISGLTQLLAAKRDTPLERQADFLQRIQNAVKRMTTLLDDVLVMIKTEVNDLGLDPVAIELEPFCQKLIGEVKLSTSPSRKVSFTYEGEHTPAHFDEVLLRQILTNLLSNAFKYSPSDSIVQFQIQRHAENVVFQIQDQGIGISPEGQESLFVAFYRAPNVGNVSGTGLGLAIAKQAVDLHGGTISFSSKVNAGTTFTITLPDLGN